MRELPWISKKRYKKEVKMLLDAFEAEAERLDGLFHQLHKDGDKERAYMMGAAEHQTRILRNWIADCFYGGFLWHVNEDSPRVVDYAKGKDIQFYKGPSEID